MMKNGIFTNLILKIITLYLVLTATLSIGIMAAILIVPLSKSPIHYTEKIYYPINGDTFCPGEKIEIDFYVNVVAAPTIIKIIDTFWSTENNRTAIADIEPKYSIIIQKEASSPRNISITVPDLPPGKYEYRHALQSEQTYPQIFITPFVIPPSCQP